MVCYRVDAVVAAAKIEYRYESANGLVRLKLD